MEEVIHIVLFKLNTEKLSSQFSDADIQRDVQKMRDSVPGLLSVEFRQRNIRPWEGYEDCTRGYNYGLVSRHTNVRALKAYQDHPVHVAFRDNMVKCAEMPSLRMELSVPKQSHLMQEDLFDKPFVALEAEEKDPVRNSVCQSTLFKFKSEPDEKTLRVLLGRVRRIPGVVELQIGEHHGKMYKGYSHNSAGHTHALFSRHLNAQLLAAFEKHPHQVALSRFLLTHVSEQPIVVSFVNIPSQL